MNLLKCILSLTMKKSNNSILTKVMIVMTNPALIQLEKNYPEKMKLQSRNEMTTYRKNFKKWTEVSIPTIIGGIDCQ